MERQTEFTTPTPCPLMDSLLLPREKRSLSLRAVRRLPYKVPESQVVLSPVMETVFSVDSTWHSPWDFPTVLEG